MMIYPLGSTYSALRTELRASCTFVQPFSQFFEVYTITVDSAKL